MPEPAASPSTRENRPTAFWDIEALSNIFMFCMYFPKSIFLSGPIENPKDWIFFFYLFDNMTMTPELQDYITSQVFTKNIQLNPGNSEIRYMNLRDETVNRLILDWFSVNNSPAFGRGSSNDFRNLVPKLKTDLDADLTFPYIIGYNTQQYDCVMLANYFNEVWGFSPSGNKPIFSPSSAHIMRDFNNILFGGYKDNMKDALCEPAKNIYENMLRTGIYIDAAKVNDKVYKMPLKRIEGMLGMDIFEDDEVKGDNPVTEKSALGNLFAYNASDCIKLSVLFRHPAYAAQFSLKKGLLDAYPDIVYKTDNTGKLSVRTNRMKADDTSAKFAQRVLCPDGWLNDIRAVSFEYPKNSGRNVLAETRAWAEEKFKNHPEVIEKYLGPVFDWYGSIEGKNYDDSQHYEQAYLFNPIDPSRIADIPMPCTTIPYFNADGTPSRTYVNFGIGGIHGAEYNMDLYLQDLAAEQAKRKAVDDFISHFTEDELKTLKPTVIIDGVKYKRSDFVTISKDKKTGEVKVKIKYPKKTELFVKTPSGNWNLNKKYVWCSDDEVDHEDFTSYYPCLLMNMRAYENVTLGEDRYVQQFQNKGKFGKYMKDTNRPKSERDFYKTMREGTKLILNSASGASDTAYDNPIRMNNVIISMRLIG